MGPEIPKFEDTIPVQASSQEPLPPKFEDTQPVSTSIPAWEETQPHEAKYETGMQQLGAGLEGAAQGFISPTVVTAAEMGLSKLGVPNMSAEDIQGRAKANPWTHGIGEAAGMAGSLMTGVGELGMLSKVPGALNDASKFAKIGSAALKGALELGAYTADDEISKSLMGANGSDPSHVVGTVLARGGKGALVGLLGGGASGLMKVGSESALNKLAQKTNSKVIKSYLAGLGYGASGVEPVLVDEFGKPINRVISDSSELHMPSFNAGRKFAKQLPQKMAEKGSEWTSELAGAKVGGIPGFVIGQEVGKQVGKHLGRNVEAASEKYLGPMILKALTTNSAGDPGVLLRLGSALGKNKRAIEVGVDSIFKKGSDEALKEYYPSETERQYLEDHLEDSDPTQTNDKSPEGYAKGGEVTPEQPDILSEAMPEHHALLNAAKIRVSNYLKKTKAETHVGGLPYDSSFKDPNKVKQHKRILDLAIKPMSVLKHIKDGSLLPHHVMALKEMYPEVHKVLSNALVKRMETGRLKGEEKPGYKTRQAMSMFLGANLDSTLSQPNILAAQMVFMKQNTQKQAENKTGKLEHMGNQTMTAEQSRTRDLNK